MDLNARVDVKFFRVDVNFHTAIVTQFHYIFFFILIPVNTNVLLIPHTKFQPNISSCSGETGDFISFAFLVMATILNSRPD